VPTARELDDPDPAEQGFHGDSDLPIDERGDRQFPPPSIDRIATTNSLRGWPASSQMPGEWDSGRRAR